MENQANETIEQNQNQTDDIKIDSWEAAFAALDSKKQEDTSATTDGDGGEPDSSNAEAAQDSADAQQGDGNGDAQNLGELDSNAGDDASSDEESSGGLFDIPEIDIEQHREETASQIRQQAINDIAAEFIKRGIRNNNGALGATLDDEDICKRDEDGVPHFYNPETGREFNGDNPRRQAQEWVDDYNKELARVFNNACKQYEDHLLKENAPAEAVLEFAPKYRKLDPIRRGMLDNVLEDYEVKNDEGKLIGYSCDLDKALALVERQVSMIQQYAKAQAQGVQSTAKAEPSGPALDMKTSSGAVPSGEQAAPKSLAEAMERLQDAQLAKLK